MSGPDRTAEDEPRVAGLQDVGSLVATARLRTLVGDAAHAECRGVEVRGLARIADGEHRRVHPVDREFVGLWRLRVHGLGCHELAPSRCLDSFNRSIGQAVIMRNRRRNL